MVYIKNLENQLNFNFNKRVNLKVLVFYVLRLAWLAIIFFINLNLFKQLTKAWIPIQLASNALLDLVNYFILIKTNLL